MYRQSLQSASSPGSEQSETEVEAVLAAVPVVQLVVGAEVLAAPVVEAVAVPVPVFQVVAAPVVEAEVVAEPEAQVAAAPVVEAEVLVQVVVPLPAAWKVFVLPAVSALNGLSC